VKHIPCSLAFIALLGSTSWAADKDLSAFGVVGDGQADDTAAIQKAVDSGAGTLRFPRGTYRLTRPVVVELGKVGFTSFVGDGVARLVMAGAGPAIKFIGTHEGTADPGSVKPGVWENQRAPMVDGLEIVGAHPAADGIEATGTMKLTITRTIVREARHGIHLTVRNRNVIISNCHLYNNRGIGVFYDGVDLHQSNITGCHISYNAGGGVVTRGGGVRNLQIGTCDIEGNMAPDSPPTANVLIDCTGGSTAEVAIVGCTLQHNSTSPGSANVVFIGRGAERGKVFDSETTRWGHLTIADNVLSDVMVNVRIEHARGVTITGNSFGLGHEHDLIVEDSSKVVVGSNVFDRNPSYFSGKADAARGGIVFRGSQDCTLNGNQIDGILRQPAAVLIEKCRDINVAGCTILDSDGPGLLLKDVRDSIVTGCLIRDRRPGSTAMPLRVDGGGNNVIRNNSFPDGGATTGTPTAK